MAVLGLGSPLADRTLVLRDGHSVHAATAELAGESRRDRSPASLLAETLGRIGLSSDDVETVVVAGRSTGDGESDPLSLTRVASRPWMANLLPRAGAYRVSAAGALARQAAAFAAGDVLVFVGEDDGVVAEGSVSTLRTVGHVGSGAAICAMAAKVAAALGAGGQEPIRALDAASGNTASPWAERFERLLTVDGSGAIEGDLRELESVLREAGSGLPGPLDDPEALHVAVLSRRADVAAGACEAIATALAQSLHRWSRRREHLPIVVAGSWFAVPRLTARVSQRLGRELLPAPLVGEPGRAVGAALCTDVPAGFQLKSLGLGRAYTPEEIKRALDRCRIDYIYESSWDRLLARTSRMLARGKQVGWFHGPSEVGDTSFGNRSVLCDPSNRYTRDNLNTFLLGRPLDATLCLAMTEEAAAEIVNPGAIGLASQWATVGERWRPRAAGVLDEAGGSAIHAVARAAATQFWDLLTTCRREHDMVGLVNVALRRADGALAVTPADAITAFFSSPVDALVIGHFLTMKDYWLMRSDM